MRHHITVSITSCLLAVLLGRRVRRPVEGRTRARGTGLRPYRSGQYPDLIQSGLPVVRDRLRDALDLIQDAVIAIRSPPSTIVAWPHSDRTASSGCGPCFVGSRDRTR